MLSFFSTFVLEVKNVVDEEEKEKSRKNGSYIPVPSNPGNRDGIFQQRAHNAARSD
jgi:hypothetical protein